VTLPVSAIDRQQLGSSLAKSSDSSIDLTGPIAAGDIEMLRKPIPSKRHGRERLAGKLAAQRQRGTVLGRPPRRSAAAPAGTAGEGVETIGDARIAPVGLPS
jgi:hypothetical protein